MPDTIVRIAVVIVGVGAFFIIFIARGIRKMTSKTTDRVGWLSSVKCSHCPYCKCSQDGNIYVDKLGLLFVCDKCKGETVWRM